MCENQQKEINRLRAVIRTDVQKLKEAIDYGKEILIEIESVKSDYVDVFGMGEGYADGFNKGQHSAIDLSIQKVNKLIDILKSIL